MESLGGNCFFFFWEDLDVDLAERGDCVDEAAAALLCGRDRADCAVFLDVDDLRFPAGRPSSSRSRSSREVACCWRICFSSLDARIVALLTRRGRCTGLEMTVESVSACSP